MKVLVRYRLLPATCVALVWLLSPTAALAQPALERLEQRLLGPANQPAAAPPAQAPLEAEPGYLGVVTRDGAPAGEGVQVVEVLRGGPADLAGLKAGDRIVRVSDVDISRMDDLAAVIQGSKAQDQLLFSIVREGQQRALLLTLGRRPPAEQRQFEAFGRIPIAGEAAAAPPRSAPVEAAGLPRSLPDGGSPDPPPFRGDKARIDLLERRVAELERRLAELERLLEQRQ